MYKELNKFLQNKKLRDFHTKITSIDKGEDCSYISYFGINFNDREILSFKVYYQFFRIFSENEFKQIMKNYGIYKELTKHWSPTTKYTHIDRGITFSFKLNADQTDSRYFHIRTKGTPMGLPDNIVLDNKTLNGYNGLNYEELSTGEDRKRKYFYFVNEPFQQLLLQKFGLSHFIKHIPLAEFTQYAESNNRKKLLFVTTSPDAMTDHLAYLKKNNYFGYQLINSILKEKDELGITSPGVDNTGTHTIYFASKKGLNNFTDAQTVEELINQSK